MIKICKQCGKEFTPRKGYDDIQLYCSKQCKKNFNKHKRYSDAPKTNLITCEHCGKTFNAKRRDTRFCSPKCSTAAYYITHKIKSAPVTIKPTINKSFGQAKCLHCRKQFKRTFPNEKFCSDECRLQYFEASPLWHAI